MPGTHFFECLFGSFYNLGEGRGCYVSLNKLSVPDAGEVQVAQHIGMFKSLGTETPVDWPRINAEGKPDGSLLTFASVWRGHLNTSRVLPMRYQHAVNKTQAARRKLDRR